MAKICLPASKLPLCLRRQPLSDVLAKGDCVVPGDVNDGMSVAAVAENVAVGTFRMTPVRALDGQPPGCLLHSLGDAGLGLLKRTSSNYFYYLKIM